jgi:hypothetical protein
MTSIADDNTPNKLLVEQGSTPATPAAGKQRLFIRSSDHLLCRVNSSGTVTVIEGASSSIPLSGWVDQTAVTWTRTGNYTFTISGNVTAVYRKGTKVRYKDEGSYEYGIVISSTYGAPNTTVTLATNSDYAMAAATITDNYYSHIENPESWPDWFNYTPTYSASGSMTFGTVTTNYAKFRVSGKKVEVCIKATGTTGGTASSSLIATLPIECVATGFVFSGVATTDTSLVAGHGFITFGSPDTVSVRKYDASNFGLGSGRVMQILAVYEME